MDEREIAGIEAACRRLSIAFAVHVDRGRADDVVALFTPDGVFERAGLRLNGAAEIAAFLAKRPATRITRHVCSNILIEPVDSTHARGIAYFTLFEGEGETPATMQLPLTVGEYRDDYVRTTNGWRIRHRRSVGIFRRSQ